MEGEIHRKTGRTREGKEIKCKKKIVYKVIHRNDEQFFPHLIPLFFFIRATLLNFSLFATFLYLKISSSSDIFFWKIFSSPENFPKLFLSPFLSFSLFLPLSLFCVHHHIHKSTTLTYHSFQKPASVTSIKSEVRECPVI